MKLSVREIDSLSVKLSNEAKKLQQQKVADYAQSKTVIKVASNVCKAIRTIPSDILEDMTLRGKYSEVNVMAQRVAYIRYKGPKAKTSTALKHEIVLLARDCKTMDEIVSKITLLE
jgi:hypothetical protein